MLSYTELKNRWNTKIKFIQYFGLTKAVQHYLKQNNKQLLKNYDIKFPNTIEIFCRSKKGCPDMYNALLLKKRHIQTRNSNLMKKEKNLAMIGKKFIHYLLSVQTYVIKIYYNAIWVLYDLITWPTACSYPNANKTRYLIS